MTQNKTKHKLSHIFVYLEKEGHKFTASKSAVWYSLYCSVSKLVGSNSGRAAYQITCISNIYSTIWLYSQSSKITVRKKARNYFVVGVHLNMRNCIK